MDKNEKNALLKRFEELKDSLDLINENVPELQKMHSEIGKQQKTLKKELEVGLVATEKNKDAAEKARSATETSAAYVKSQEEKLDQCLAMLESFNSEINSLKRKIHELESRPQPVATQRAQPTTNPQTQRTTRDTGVNRTLQYEPLETEDGRIKLKIDTEANKLQLHFDPASASEPYRDSMRENGYRYYRPMFCWSATISEANYDYAKELIDGYEQLH